MGNRDCRVRSKSMKAIRKLTVADAEQITGMGEHDYPTMDNLAYDFGFYDFTDLLISAIANNSNDDLDYNGSTSSNSYVWELAEYVFANMRRKPLRLTINDHRFYNAELDWSATAPFQRDETGQRKHRHNFLKFEDGRYILMMNYRDYQAEGGEGTIEEFVRDIPDVSTEREVECIFPSLNWYSL